MFKVSKLPRYPYSNAQINSRSKNLAENKLWESSHEWNSPNVPELIYVHFVLQSPTGPANNWVSKLVSTRRISIAGHLRLMVLTGLSVQEVGSKRMANKQQIKKSERNWLVQKGKCTWKNSKTNESWLWDLGTVVKDSVPKMITGCSLFARFWVGAPQLMSGDESQKKIIFLSE